MGGIPCCNIPSSLYLASFVRDDGDKGEEGDNGDPDPGNKFVEMDKLLLLFFFLPFILLGEPGEVLP